MIPSTKLKMPVKMDVVMLTVVLTMLDEPFLIRFSRYEYILLQSMSMERMRSAEILYLSSSDMTVAYALSHQEGKFSMMSLTVFLISGAMIKTMSAMKRRTTSVDRMSEIGLRRRSATGEPFFSAREKSLCSTGTRRTFATKARNPPITKGVK